MKNTAKTLTSLVLAALLCAMCSVLAFAENPALQYGDNSVECGVVYTFTAGEEAGEEGSFYLFTADGDGLFTYGVINDMFAFEDGTVMVYLMQGESVDFKVEGDCAVTVNVSTFSFDPIDPDYGDYYLEIGDNTVEAGHVYTIYAPGTGTYTFTVDGDVQCGIILFGEVQYDNFETYAFFGEPIYFQIDGEGEVSVNVTFVEAEPEVIEPDIMLELGVNKDVAISGFGTKVGFTAPEAGRYYLSGEGLFVGVSTEFGADYEINYYDVEEGETVVFFVLPIEWEDVVTDVTISLDNPDAGDAGVVMLVILSAVAALGCAAVIKNERA